MATDLDLPSVYLMSLEPEDSVGKRNMGGMIMNNTYLVKSRDCKKLCVKLLPIEFSRHLTAEGSSFFHLALNCSMNPKAFFLEEAKDGADPISNGLFEFPGRLCQDVSGNIELATLHFGIRELLIENSLQTK